MILADVNLLVYAFDSDCPDNPRYLPWLSDVLTGDEEFALADPRARRFSKAGHEPQDHASAQRRAIEPIVDASEATAGER